MTEGLRDRLRLGLTVSVVVLVASASVLAAGAPPSSDRTGAEDNMSSALEGTATRIGPASLQSRQSPGYKIGETWYDEQHIGSMGRMVDRGYDASNGFIIHYALTGLDQPVFIGRHFSYSAYFANTGSLLTPVSIQPSDDYAGYCGLDVMDTYGAVVGGNNNVGCGTSPYFYYDFSPGLGFFGRTCIADPPLCNGAHSDNESCPIWPKFRYQDVPGHTPVTPRDCPGGPTG